WPSRGLYRCSHLAALARPCLGSGQPDHAGGAGRGRGSSGSVAVTIGIALTIALAQPSAEPPAEPTGPEPDAAASELGPPPYPPPQAGREIKGLVAAWRDQQDVVAIHEHELALDGGRLARAAQKMGGGIRHGD